MDDKTHNVKALRGYKDLELKRHVDAGETYWVTKERADYLEKEVKFAKVIETKLIETPKSEEEPVKAVKKEVTKKKPVKKATSKK